MVFLKKEKIQSWKKFKHTKIIHLTNFIFDQTSFPIVSYQIFKNNMILRNEFWK